MLGKTKTQFKTEPWIQNQDEWRPLPAD